MKEHVLKTWPEPFEASWSGDKPFEFRRDDRGYQVGDHLVLREFEPEAELFSGRELFAAITYVLRPVMYDVPPGYAVLGTRIIGRTTRCGEWQRLRDIELHGEGAVQRIWSELKARG
ncbi:MAG: ASCH/PUA domain-containing protein [Candidatus Acidiferrales bacterium]